MNWLQNIKPLWALRLGLGLMYLYSGFDIITHPTAWYWALRALPQALYIFVINNVGIDLYLRLQGFGELILAALFLAWFLPRWTLSFAAFLAIIEFIFILIFVGIDPVTFRDIGLLSAAIALFCLSVKQQHG